MDQHEDEELSRLLKTQAERHTTPRDLRSRIVSAIRKQETAEEKRFSGWRAWMNRLGAFAAGMAAGLAITFIVTTRNAREELAQEVVASHVRSLMVAHLTDVDSTDQHTVKPWFNGKLDFSPPVPDLAAAGFPLTGGRLDYIDGHPAAALIYRHRQHIINVFVWPRERRSPAPPVSFEKNGFNVTGWGDKAMQFWAVSDLNAAELQQFVQRLRQAE